jgi:hypothetical protein
MKIKCGKCKTLLTEDLYYAKVSYDKYHFLTPSSMKKVMTTDHGIPYDQNDYRMKKGLFYIRKGLPSFNRTYDYHGIEGYYKVVKATKDTLVVGERSLLEGVVPPFQSGYGCCNYNMGEELLCKCGNTLGEMYLDCFESGVVYLKEESVDRCY